MSFLVFTYVLVAVLLGYALKKGLKWLSLWFVLVAHSTLLAVLAVALVGPKFAGEALIVHGGYLFTLIMGCLCLLKNLGRQHQSNHGMTPNDSCLLRG